MKKETAALPIASAGVALAAAALTGAAPMIESAANATPSDEPAATPATTPGLVTLDRPIVRGAKTITEVIVRQPSSGELRGLTLMALTQLDVNALQSLLPRITLPMLTKQEIAALKVSDLMQLGGEVMDFLLPNAAKTDSAAQ